VNGRFLASLQEDYYLQLPGTEETMIIESANIKTNAETGNRFIVKGRALSSMLDRRLVFQRTIFEDVALQDAIETLLTQNGIDSPGQPQRNIPGLVFLASTDPVVLAPVLTAQYYTEGLYETIQFLCQRSNLGFKIILNASNEFEFSLYAGQDRSYNQLTNPFVVFSPKFDNLKSSDYFHSKKFLKTIALIAGDAYYGGPRPTFDFDPWENDPTDPHYPTIRTGLDRRELYVDAPDLNYIDPDTGLPYGGGVGSPYIPMMYERARQELNKNTIFESFDGEIDTTQGYNYRQDYFLGDIVQVENEYGIQGTKQVTEVIISENNSGVGVYPTFEEV
jgi:hypothetical protein